MTPTEILNLTICSHIDAVESFVNHVEAKLI